MDDDAVLAELRRAEAFFAGLELHTLDVVTIESPSAADAPFLGRNISKLSPFVSNLIERDVVQRIAEDLDPGGGFDWVRQDPGWPDAGLFHDGLLVGGFEVKAWYVLATEMTGRFHAAQSAISGIHGRVIVVPWVMDRIVFGRPMLLGHFVVDALELATQRDAYYHRPPDRIVVEPPQDERARNLRQTNVIGQKLQTVTSDQRQRAKLFASKFAVKPVPHDPDTVELNRYLLENFPYREESNFGKLGRTFLPGLKAFEAETLDMMHRGGALRGWRQILTNLGSDVEPVRQIAEAVVATLYTS